MQRRPLRSRRLPRRSGRMGNAATLIASSPRCTQPCFLGATELDQPVRVQIAQQQRDLKEHQAGGPDRRRSAEPWQNHAGDQGLDQKQQEGAEKYSCGELPGVARLFRRA